MYTHENNVQLFDDYRNSFDKACAMVSDFAFYIIAQSQLGVNFIPQISARGAPTSSQKPVARQHEGRALLDKRSTGSPEKG